MADITGGEKTAGIYWIKDTSDEDQPMVFVPGVTAEGNLRKVLTRGSGSSSARKERTRAGNGGEMKGIAGVGCVIEARKKRSPWLVSRPKASLPSVQVKAGLHSSIIAGTPFRSPVLSPPKPIAIHFNQQAQSEVAQARSSASLKDLCPEDKRRIANLIQELARVSEEKDETEQRLKDGQESFERKIQQLEQQNQLIIQEREGLQQQYRECQELLGLYQQYLSQQQDKLNHSIAHLNHSHSQVTGSEGVARQPTMGGAVGLDGSYLGLPNVCGAGLCPNGSYLGLPNTGGAGVCPNGSHLGLPNTGGARVCLNGSYLGLPNMGGTGVCPNGSHLGVRNMGGAGLGMPPGMGRTKDGQTGGVRSFTENNHMATPPQCLPSSGQDSDLNEKRGFSEGRRGHRAGPQSSREGSGTSERRHSRRYAAEDNREDRESNTEKGVSHSTTGGERRRVDRNPAPCHPSRVGSHREPVTTTSPPFSRVDWEERKHWLLLQKMELEVQRERLQAQLALQEERLILQNKQLRQSRIDYNRFRGAAPELDPTEDSGAVLSGAAQRHQAKRGTVSAPSASGEAEDPGRLAAQQEGGEEAAALPLQTALQPKEALPISRRDAATSPAAAQTQLLPDPPLIPALPKTPCARLQSSLVELLDMFSPVAVPSQRRAACQRRASRHPRPAPLSSLLSPWAPPHRPPASPEEDAEESQILEDIFFIC